MPLRTFDAISLVSGYLEKLEISYAFIGGGILELLLDNPKLTPPRPTLDVDVIVNVITNSDYAKLEEQLRKLGFQHDVREGAPIGRYQIEDCTVDIQPIESKVLGMNTRWHKEALEAAQKIKLHHKQVPVIQATHFLATKLEAFKDRGKSDLYGSKDFEDIVTILNGRAFIVEEIKASQHDLQNYLATKFRALLQSGRLEEAILGHLSDMDRTVSIQRRKVILDRMKEIIEIINL